MIKKKRCEYLFYFLAFVIPVIVMLFVLAQKGFYPFGDKTLFVVDMKKQFLAFYSYLQRCISGEESAFFSWSRSLGGNSTGLYAYYIASPFALIVSLFSLRDMPLAMAVLMLVKIGLCGLTFSIFAFKYWDMRRGIKDGRMVMVLLPVSISYALMSYNIAYSLGTMWIDGIIWLPLILLGIEGILAGKKYTCYVFSLAVLFVSNWYIGYMTGIFVAIYFLYRIFSSKEFSSRLFVLVARFAGGTLLSVGLAAPILFPTLSNLISGKWSQSKIKVPASPVKFSIWQLFVKMTNGAYDSIRDGGSPYIYCGYFVIISVIIFLVTRKVRIREKIGALIVMLIFAISFYFTFLDIVWHGFQPPVWFPHRYSFCFSFFLCYLAVVGLCTVLSNGRKEERSGRWAFYL